MTQGWREWENTYDSTALLFQNMLKCPLSIWDLQIRHLSTEDFTMHAYHRRTTTHTQTSTPGSPICSVRDSWSLLPGGFRKGQSVSVISVYVSSQSWEWHETHKASLCQPCGLQQLVPPHCRRKKKHAFLKNSFETDLVFMLVLPKSQEGDMLKAQTAWDVSLPTASPLRLFWWYFTQK